MVSFGVPGERAFGGVGVMIDRPGVALTMTLANPPRTDTGRGCDDPSRRFTATGPLAERAVAFARMCADAWRLDGDAACSIELTMVPGSHAGLGSGTQLALAVAAGMWQLFGPPREDAAAGPRRFSAAEAVMLARAVGRGRRSCVGVYGFSGGGLIVEGGRCLPLHGAGDDDRARPFSPLLARVVLPEAWRCVVFGLRDEVGLHGDEEKRAFATLPPVPREIAAELARIALVALLPAAVDGNFAEFSQALFEYGLLAGKPFEPVSAALPYARSTARLIDSLRSWGVRGCGQSSWGPTVLACCGSPEEADALVARFAVNEAAERYDATIARFAAQGATVRDCRTVQAPVTDRP